jgi:hypothetical protein
MAPFAALKSAPRMVRAHVRSVLALWRVDEGITEVAELVASELVTNSVLASTNPQTDAPMYRAEGGILLVGFRIFYTPLLLLRLESWDQVAGVPALAVADDDAESGRGLSMVAMLTAGRWGWQPGCDGWAKYTWAEVRA